MNAYDRLEMFLDKVVAAVFAAPTPVVLVWICTEIYLWATGSGASWNPSKDGLSRFAGNEGFQLLVGFVALALFVEAISELRKLFRKMTPEELDEWRKAKSESLWAKPKGSKDGVSYVLTRTAQFVFGGIGACIGALLCGRVIAFLFGDVFLPSSGELAGIGAISIFTVAVLVLISWTRANKELTHARAGDELDHTLAFKIFCLAPYTILYEVVGIVAKGGDEASRAGGTALAFGWLFIFAWEALMAPVTKWMDKQYLLDRMTAPKQVAKVKDATAKAAEAESKEQFGRGIRKRRD